MPTREAEVRSTSALQPPRRRSLSPEALAVAAASAGKSSPRGLRRVATTGSGSGAKPRRKVTFGAEVEVIPGGRALDEGQVQETWVKRRIADDLVEIDLGKLADWEEYDTQLTPVAVDKTDGHCRRREKHVRFGESRSPYRVSQSAEEFDDDAVDEGLNLGLRKGKKEKREAAKDIQMETAASGDEPKMVRSMCKRQASLEKVLTDDFVEMLRNEALERGEKWWLGSQ